MNALEKTELFNELDKQFTIGSSEFELAVRNTEKNGTSVADEIQRHRAKFEKNRTASIGAAQYASSESWEAIRQDSEKAAREALLGESTMLTEVNELTRKADEARRLADQRSRELQALWSEFQNIPGKMKRLSEQLDGITSMDW